MDAKVHTWFTEKQKISYNKGFDDGYVDEATGTRHSLLS